jgi:hypothetical protein
MPEETQKAILGEMSLPRVKAKQPSGSSKAHQSFTRRLRKKFAKNKKDFIVVDEESGLDSGILPKKMDITIKDATGIISFIEIDGPYHFVTLADGKKILTRKDQLREELYKFNHPGVPLMRINLREQQRFRELVISICECFSSTPMDQAST